MNFENLNFDYVEQQPQDYAQFYALRPASPHSQTTVVPYDSDSDSFDSFAHGYYAQSSVAPATPEPQRRRAVPLAPSPPSPDSYPELYGPDRLFGPPLAAGVNAAFFSHHHHQLTIPAAAASRSQPFEEYPSPSHPPHHQYQYQYHHRQPSLSPSPSPPASVTYPPLVRQHQHQQHQQQYPYPHPPLSTPSPIELFDTAETVMASFFAAGGAANPNAFKDDAARDAGTVTPGVDDTPYIQYALEALTRDPATGRMHARVSTDTRGDDLADRIVDPAFGQVSDTVPMLPSPVARRPSRTGENKYYHARVTSGGGGGGGRPMSVLRPVSSAASTIGRAASHLPRLFDKTSWRSVRVDEMGVRDFIPLRAKPAVLGLPSMLGFMATCLLMVVALIFSGTYSAARDGFWAFSNTIYDGQYFVFRILPQLLGVFVLLYAQAVMLATYRLYPFACLASNYPKYRLNAIHLEMYPKSFLWPHLVGTWHIKLPIVAVWLANFTIPLLSASFTVVYVAPTWKWAAVQGVTWTLVALYVVLLIAMGVLTMYWHGRRTGLLWDARSVADVIALLPHSNTMDDFHPGFELLADGDLKKALPNRIEKLGWWWVQDPTKEMWYGIGIADDEENTPVYEIESPVHGKTVLTESLRSTTLGQLDPHQVSVRRRYLPWCMRSNQLLFFVVTATVLLIALYVVSFLPGTDIRAGFRPWLDAAPQAGAFSPADFLYSFLPALLGVALALLFQSLDLSLRVLQPWAELNRPEGSRAQRSLLADYAACLPLQCSWRAARNRHWRVAAVSFLAVAFWLIPVLAGGMFIALLRGDRVLMFPQVPTFGWCLAFLTLFPCALAAVLPGRAQFRLPHAVTTLAGVISLCASRALREDPAFAGGPATAGGARGARSKLDLRARLDVGRDRWAQARWALATDDGAPFGRDPAVPLDDRLSVRRLRSPRHEGGPAERRATAAAAARAGRIAPPQQQYQQQGEFL